MELSILIPARNEPYLQKTVDDLKAHIEADTEILVGEDTQPIGQRAMTNRLAKEAKGRFLLKLDAHVSVGPGFDRILLEQMDERTILAPTLLPLKGESWTTNGKKQMKQFVFDQHLVMQHAEGEAGETMCLQGSSWVVHKDTYWKWELGDESLGSWGSQGVELGIKAFLNGGRCMTTDKTYYGHVFRHQDSDFPYDRGLEPGKYANQEMLRRYKNKSIAPLIEKFGYPADWTKESVEALD